MLLMFNFLITIRLITDIIIYNLFIAFQIMIIINFIYYLKLFISCIIIIIQMDLYFNKQKL